MQPAARPVHAVPVNRDEPPEADIALPDRVVAGAAAARVWNAFSSGRFHAGHWQAEPGIRRVAYDETELCVILSGRVRLTASDGRVQEFGPGQAFVIPGGFHGTWETLETVTKVYAILEAPE